MFDQAAAEYADDDVLIVGVNVMDTHESAVEFLERVDVSYPNIEDDNATSLGVEYGVTGVPETFVINAEGEIATYFWGEITNTQQIRELVALAR